MKGDPTARLALARNLCARINRFADVGGDELRVVDVLLSRIELGFHDYGPLDLAKHRDWKRERAEEVIDGAFYEACHILSNRDARIAAIESGLEEIASVAPTPHEDLLGFDLSELGGEGG